MKTKTIICLYGGPGCGKTTTSAGLFYKLKLKGYNSELIREYIKDWVWEKRVVGPGDQTYFFAKQSKKERSYIQNELDFIVTDSPLILTHFYGLKYDEMEQKSNTSLAMLMNHHEFCKSRGYKVEHFVLTRQKHYNPAGRFQNESEAREIDGELVDFLKEHKIKYTEIAGGEGAVDDILAVLHQKFLDSTENQGL